MDKNMASLNVCEDFVFRYVKKLTALPKDTRLKGKTNRGAKTQMGIDSEPNSKCLKVNSLSNRHSITEPSEGAKTQINKNESE